MDCLQEETGFVHYGPVWIDFPVCDGCFIGIDYDDPGIQGVEWKVKDSVVISGWDLHHIGENDAGILLELRCPDCGQNVTLCIGGGEWWSTDCECRQWSLVVEAIGVCK